MKLLLKLKDMCYYDYNGEIVWVTNKFPYLESTYKERIQYLKERGLL